jgi:hypothetical protein
LEPEVTQLGEAVAMGLLPSSSTPKQGPGNLHVKVIESSSEEAVQGVKVTISGPASASAISDIGGECRFEGIAAGSYRITLTQAEIEMTPSNTTAAVEADQTQVLPIRVKRVLTTVVMKRIHIQGLLKAAIGDKSQRIEEAEIVAYASVTSTTPSSLAGRLVLRRRTESRLGGINPCPVLPLPRLARLPKRPISRERTFTPCRFARNCPSARLMQRRAGPSIASLSMARACVGPRNGWCSESRCQRT